MEEQDRTLRYMTRFRCIGGDCEDTCCEHWNVLLDRSSYKRIRRALRGAPQERQRFADAVVRSDQAEQRRNLYALRLKKDGSCKFLTAQKECFLQVTYGKSLLPDVCSSYPRVVRLVGGRAELSGKLSCPEVARLCLLADDALEIDSLEPDLLKRHRVDPMPVTLNTEAPYHQAFDAIRELATMLLRVRSFPLASRLFFIGSLALRVERDFHKHADESALEGLGREVERLCDPVTLERLHEELLAVSLADHRTMHIVGHSLADLLNTMGHPTLRRVITQAFASYSGVAPETIELEATPESSISVVEAESAYFQRKQEYAAVGERIERYFENYALNYFITEAHVNSPSLLCHLEKLLMRMAILRVLLTGHPRLQLAFASSSGVVEALDAAAVETFYSFSRGIEHSQRCMTSMHKAWEDVPNPERLHRLLKFLG